MASRLFVTGSQVPISFSALGAAAGGVGVEGTGVEVGGTGVGVGGIGVRVGGTGVRVGGAGVEVGGAGAAAGAPHPTKNKRTTAISTRPIVMVSSWPKTRVVWRSPPEKECEEYGEK